MVKPIFPVVTFSVLIPLLFFFSFGLLIESIDGSQSHNALAAGQVLSASTREELSYPQFLGSFGTTDARVHIISNYLKKYSSPLLPEAQTLVDISDKYSLDYRLLVAIARQESNLCKKIPPDSHNCWGFGIYGNKVTRFDNYPQAIETVARTLKRNYIDMGLETPLEIMAKYTPPSLEIGGPWAKSVNQFMIDLE